MAGPVELSPEDPMIPVPANVVIIPLLIVYLYYAMIIFAYHLPDKF